MKMTEEQHENAVLTAEAIELHRELIRAKKELENVVLLKRKIVSLEQALKEHKIVLGISAAAIECLTLTQKDEGMGLLGQHLVGPETLKKIKEVLKETE